MSNNTLPVIEIGDTVIFRTDLVENEFYGVESFEPSMVEFTHKPQIVRAVSDNYFTIENDNWDWAFTSKMVAQVIKPTKERVYTESQVQEAMLKILEYAFECIDNEQPADTKKKAKEIIESLNK